MPLYESQCRKCGAEADYYSTIADRLKPPACRKCGGETAQIISAVRGFGDIPEYVSPASGKLIRGRHQRAEDFKVTGTRPYEGFEAEKREIDRAKKYRAEKEEKRLDDVLGRTIEDLDASNKLEVVGDRSQPLPDTTGMRVL